MTANFVGVTMYMEGVPHSSQNVTIAARLATGKFDVQETRAGKLYKSRGANQLKVKIQED